MGFDVVERKLGYADLVLIRNGAIAKCVSGFDPALEHEFDLVDIAILGGELMVLADVVAHEEQCARLDLRTKFFPTFALHRLVECFSWLLPTAWQNIVPSDLILVGDCEQVVILDDDCLGRIPNWLHASLLIMPGHRPLPSTIKQACQAEHPLLL